MSNRSHAESASRVTQPPPTIGRIVIFTFDDYWASMVPSALYKDGDEAPAIVTRVHSDAVVNLKVFLDGPLDLSVTSVLPGPKGAPRCWRWPERA
jgi:hypothetical protein